MKYLTRTTNLHATIALARETNTKIIIDFRSQVYTFRYITFGFFTSTVHSAKTNPFYIT